MATLLVTLPIDRLISSRELTLETGCVKPDLSIERNNVVTGGGRIAERLPSRSLRRAERGMQAASAERPIRDLGPRMPGFLGLPAGRRRLWFSRTTESYLRVVGPRGMSG